MGTRSIIKFYKNNDLLVSVYQQYDGYLEGVGKDLAQWLLNKKIVNEIGLDQYSKNFSNGAGCLAAQYIKDNKPVIGGLYIEVPKNDISELDYVDYIYEVYIYDTLVDYKGTEADKCIDIKIFTSDGIIFAGNPGELLKYIEVHTDDD